MSPKRKPKKETSISITGGVKGIGNVIGNDSQSNVSISATPEKSSSDRDTGKNVLWPRLITFLVALIGILVAVGLFVRLLQGFNTLLVAELVLAGLVSALGISGFLKPSLLVELFSRLFGKK